MGKSKPERQRRIESHQNSTVKRLREAFAHGGVSKNGDCAIEGPRILEEAIRAGIKLQTVIFSEDARVVSERLMPQLDDDVETIVVPEDVFRSAVSTESPQGVAALLERPKFSLKDILQSENPLCLVLAGIQDPGNLGTLLRSAEAFGASGVILTENTVSPWNSKAVRASAGSVLRLPTLQLAINEIVMRLREHGLKLVGSSSHRGKVLAESDLRGPLALFMGNEGAGLAKELLERMDERVMVPQTEQVESLNAGVAGSIMLYEISRQRASGNSAGRQSGKQGKNAKGKRA